MNSYELNERKGVRAIRVEKIAKMCEISAKILTYFLILRIIILEKERAPFGGLTP